MTRVDRDYGSCVGYAAALWAFVFGTLHIVWASGWYVGLDPERARKAFDQPWFVAFDLVVAVVCLAAIGVALAIVRPWGRRIPRWALGLLASIGTGALTLRAVGGLTQLLSRVVDRPFVAHPMDVWELWFCLGAILFGFSTWRFWTARATSSVAGQSRG